MRNKTINMYTEWKPLILGMEDSKAGLLLKTMFLYQSEEEVNFKNPVWFFIKSKMDEYNNKGSDISQARSIAGKKGGLAKSSKSKHLPHLPSKPSNKIKEKKIKENKVSKNTHGEFEKVKLSEDEFKKVEKLYGEFSDEAIQKLDNYIASKGDKYKSHYAVLCKGNWVYRDFKDKIEAEEGGSYL